MEELDREGLEAMIEKTIKELNKVVENLGFSEMELKKHRSNKVAPSSLVKRMIQSKDFEINHLRAGMNFKVVNLCGKCNSDKINFHTKWCDDCENYIF